MAFYRSTQRTVLVKVESTAGTDAAPVPGSNAVSIEAPTSTPNFATVNTNEVGGSFDRRAAIPAGGDRTFSGRVYFHGSGTAGTVPEADPLLKACGLAINTIAADVTGTATGGAAATITLAAGASAVDNAYRGAVIELTSGTGSGQKAIIVSYVGSTKVATVTPAWTVQPTTGTGYVVRAGNIYSPTSVNIPTVTVYDYHHRTDGGNSKLKKLLGGAGNARLTFAPRQLPSWQFDLRGLMSADTDVTAPAAPTLQATRPVAFQNAQVCLGNATVALNNLTLDLGNTTTAEDDPNAPYGASVASITARGINGSMALPKGLESARNVFDSWSTGVKANLSIIWGAAAGNRGSVLITDIIYTGLTDQDINGLNYDNLPFSVDAQDSSVYVCYW